MAQQISYLLCFQFTLLTPLHRDFTAIHISLKKQVGQSKINHKHIPAPLLMTSDGIVLWGMVWLADSTIYSPHNNFC